MRSVGRKLKVSVPVRLEGAQSGKRGKQNPPPAKPRRSVPRNELGKILESNSSPIESCPLGQIPMTLVLFSFSSGIPHRLYIKPLFLALLSGVALSPCYASPFYRAFLGLSAFGDADCQSRKAGMALQRPTVDDHRRQYHAFPCFQRQRN
jgi:hypothetical protein